MRGFDWAGNGVSIPYVILMTGRCGSTLLTRLLHDTGLCGTPDEFFNERVIPELRRKLGAEGFADYFAAVVTAHTSGRRFGFEIDPFRFDELCRMLDFAAVFPLERTAFFWMTRRDIVAQAWSYANAKKSGLWHVYADGSEERAEPATAAGVEDHEWWSELLLMLRGEQSMERFFLAAGIGPYRLDYEMLVTDRYHTLVKMLQALACTPAEIEAGLAGLDEKTRRHDYADWHPAVIRFRDAYRDELHRVETARLGIDVYQLRAELMAKYGLAL